MRIVHLIATLAEQHGGPSRVCVDMARAVARRGHHVSVHSTNFGFSAEHLEAVRARDTDGVDVHYHPIELGGAWPFSSSMWRAIGPLAAEADVVHMHSFYLFHNLAGWLACRRHGTPYLLRPHGTLDPYLWRRHRARKWVIENLYMNRVVDGAAALHYTTKEEMHLAAPIARGARGVVIPNGVRFEDFAGAPRGGRYRTLFETEKPIRLVLFLGRLNFKKGLDLLAPAFAALASRDPAARLLIAGPDGGMEQPMRSRLGELGVSEKVRFTGQLRDEEVRAAYGDADLFVLPSYSENFGNAVIEAMASGTPVLISDQVNIWREIETSGAGRVVPCEVGRLADTMAEMLADPAGLAAAALAAKAAAEEYRWERVAERLEEVYGDLA